MSEADCEALLATNGDDFTDFDDDFDLDGLVDDAEYLFDDDVNGTDGFETDELLEYVFDDDLPEYNFDDLPETNFDDLPEYDFDDFSFKKRRMLQVGTSEELEYEYTYDADEVDYTNVIWEVDQMDFKGVVDYYGVQANEYCIAYYGIDYCFAVDDVQNILGPIYADMSEVEEEFEGFFQPAWAQVEYDDFNPFGMQEGLEWDLNEYELEATNTGRRGADTTPAFNLDDFKPFLPEDWDTNYYNYNIDQDSYYESLYGSDWSYGTTGSDETSEYAYTKEDCYYYNETWGYCCNEEWYCYYLYEYYGDDDYDTAYMYGEYGTDEAKDIYELVA
jgi:hypothetical protein